MMEKLIQNYKHKFVKDLLKGKVAFISGGGSGIGFTISEILMRHGCDTVIASRNLTRLEESASTLEKGTGSKCLPVKLDVRDQDLVEDGVKKALAHYGKINYLVNCAAGNFPVLAADLTPKGFKTVLEIDTLGTFILSRTVYNSFFKGHGGAIVNITATLQHRGQPMQAHAGSAKAAIEAMTKHLAVEWGPAGVRVNCVAPGPIADTEGMNRLGGAKLLGGDLVKGIPLQRIGTREEIGECVLYLLSDASSLVTSQTLIADGGDYLTNVYCNIPIMEGLLSKM